MGWTVMDHRPRGESHEEFFTRELLSDWHEILASAQVGGIGGTFYAAVRDQRTGQVWALVVATTGCVGSRFGWKAMEERMGPFESECPARVLDLLSPTDDQHALSWRARCRDRLERLAAVIPDAEVCFEADFLTPEGPCRRFVTVDPGKDHFRGLGPTVYRLKDWRRTGFKVLSKSEG